MVSRISTSVSFSDLLMLLLSLCLTGCSHSFGQVFRHFGEKEAAPVAPTYEIAQDQKGFMWFATTTGLYRYDSRRFRKYGESQPASPEEMPLYVQSVKPDSKGNIWAGTLEGVYLYDEAKDKFLSFRNSEKEGGNLDGIRVYTILEDSKGRIWAGTKTGLGLVTRKDGKISVSDKLPPTFKDRSRSVRSIAEGPDGTLWLGTYDGLIRYRSENDAQLFKRTPKATAALLNEYVAVYADKKGTIWAGSNHEGLVQFNPVTETFTTLDYLRDKKGTLPVVNKILPDGKDTYWIATESGLVHLDAASHSMQWLARQQDNPYSLVDNILYSAFIDKQGGIWTGAYYLGVSYMHPDSPVFSRWPTITHGVPYDFFLNGWIGMTKGGRKWVLSYDSSRLIVFERNSTQSRLYKLNIPSSDVHDLVRLDDNSILWCAGRGGVSRVDLLKNSVNLFPFKGKDALEAPNWKIYSMSIDSAGSIWIGGTCGLLKFNEKNGDFEKIPHVNRQVRASFIDSRQRLWVGCRGAVYMLSDNSTKIDSTALDGKTSEDFEESENGQIWMLLNGNLFRHQSKKSGVVFEKVLDGSFNLIRSDNNGYLWLDDNTKLLRYDPHKNVVQSYSYREGLPLNSVLRGGLSFRDPAGILYFTTNNELFQLNPNRIATIETPGRIIATSVKLFNREVTTGDKTGILEKSLSENPIVRLRHDQNVVSLDFALLSYFKSEENQYAYKLEGFEKEWNYVNIPSVTYTSLPSGTYTLLVKAANGDGYWTTEPLRITIVVLPPWWKTWYAYLFYLALLAVSVYGVTRFFWLRTLVRKENEVYQAKLDFFTNISHEIRTHLSLISGPLESAFSAPETPKKTQKLLGYAKNNSDRLLSLVSELLDFRKIQNGKIKLRVSEYDVVKSLKSVITAFEHQATQKDITLGLKAPDYPVILWMDNAQMQKVFFNLIGNSLKFTPEGGDISVAVHEASNEVKIEFIDNGKGIATHHLDHLFANFYQVYDENQGNTGYGIGLALAREIALKHHGDLSVASKLQSGDEAGETVFTLRLFKGNWQFQTDQIAPPLRQQESQTNLASDMESENTQEKAPDHLNGMHTHRVLLIEDNDELREFGVEMLREKFGVLQANNGKDGLELAKEQIPDIIVCDVMMPHLTGLEVCRLIKKDFNTRHIPVILISARSTSAQMIEGLGAGADDYLIKPFSFEVLEMKIGNLIRSREAYRQQYTKIVSLEPNEIELQDLDAEFVTRLRDFVLERLSDSGLSVEEISLHLGTSVSVLYRKLRALTGMTVNEFIKSIRMKRAYQLLDAGVYNVSEVAAMVGFEDSKYFSREFTKVYGIRPKEIKKTGKS